MTAVQSSNRLVSFDVYDGEQLVERVAFTQHRVTIGETGTADLGIDDASVARMHAVVEVDSRTGGDVLDLGSTAGTYLNRQRVHRARLRSGDELVIGRYRLLVAFGDEIPAHEPVRHLGLCVVRPGTALVVRSRRTGELKALRTSGRVMTWPWLHVVSELDLTAVTVLAAASGEGAPASADGMRGDLTLRLTLRPRRDEATLRGIVASFGLPPSAPLVASRVVETLTPVLAEALATLPRSELHPSLALEAPPVSAHGYDLERVEVLHVGDAAPEPAGGYRGGPHDLDEVRFEGSPVPQPPEPLEPVTKPRRRVAASAITWAEADTSQRVVIGWFILVTSLPVGALMAAAGASWIKETLFVLALCALANVLVHLRTLWCLPPAALSIYQCVRVANDPSVSLAGLLLSVALWCLVVVIFARNSPQKARKP